MIRPTHFLLLIFIFTVTLGGCVSLDRRELAREVAHGGGFSSEVIKTDFFDLLSYYRFKKPHKALIIYLEGDGLAWINRNTLSKDPTPRNPLALRLASLDTASNVAYLGRPCQYVQNSQRRNCKSDYWSKARFSEEVIVATNQAIDQLKKQAFASYVHIVGYSGGGGIGVLVAARRNDIDSIRTVAGNLDHAVFTSHHKVTPLKGSLNPVDVADKIAKIPQIHFVGSKDKIVPAFIADGFVAAQGGKTCAKVEHIAAMKHNGDWDKAWPGMLQHSLPKCNME
ncbi:MAG: alpha/beta hydrolase [Magnetococcales bacterium]|nr:alpha/beta hydrolase [Magnetococcales bacterium]